jgi:hypothetical protein
LNINSFIFKVFPLNHSIVRFTLLSTLLVLSFLLPIAVRAQSDSSISFIAYWKKGDVRKFRITKTETRVNKGVRAKDKQSSFEVTCRVVDSTAQGYRMLWESENETLKAMQVPLEFKDLVSKYGNLKIEYLTEETGSFKEILNWKEVGDLMGEMLDLLVKADTSKSQGLAKAMAPLRKALLTKEGIEALVLQDIQLLHYPMGIQIETSDSIPYEMALPNVLGGAPMKGIGSIKVKNWNPQTGVCDFVNVMKIDSSDAKTMVTQLVGSMIKNMDYKTEAERQKAVNDASAEFNKMVFDISDYYHFRYQVDPGWPIRIEGGRKTVLVSGTDENRSEKNILIETVK